MSSFLKNRFGIPGVISMVALVFAMAGGAYAAKKYVITSTSQIKPSVLNQLKGKPGPAGPAGAAGAKGDSGAAGATGDTGAPGSPGTPGANGTPGSEGPEGPEGTPWTVGGTLPSEATETGTWSFGAIPSDISSVKFPISFTVPLGSNLSES